MPKRGIRPSNRNERSLLDESDKMEGTYEPDVIVEDHDEVVKRMLKDMNTSWDRLRGREPR